jgi:hypothetical protein
MIHRATAGGTSMSSSLTGFSNTTITILRAARVRDEYGEQVATWAPLVDHIDVPALMAGGDVSVRLKKQEFRTSQNIFEAEYRRLMLFGPYDSTIDRADRCQVEGKDWAIVSIATDVTRSFTELVLESIEPGDI